MLREDNVIALVTENRLPHYEPYGWHHWPEHPWFIEPVPHSRRQGHAVADRSPMNAAPTGVPHARSAHP